MVTTVQSATEIGGIAFLPVARPGDQPVHSQESRFVLAKSADSIAFYQSLTEQAPKTILEFGLFEGGSLVFFDKLFAPAKIAGVDIRRQPIPALEAYRRGRDHILVFYGAAQDDAQIRGKIQSAFPAGLDLVVDDASHQFGQTCATFEQIFPLVRPGGLYVIEEWGWSHKTARQNPSDEWFDKPGLTNLVFILTVIAATCRVIDSLTVHGSLVCIRKGKGVLPKSGLDVSGQLRGREMALI